MKHFNFKKILYTLLGGVMGIALFVSLGGMSQAAGSNPPGPLNLLYDQAGGPMHIAQFQMARKHFDRDDPAQNASVFKQGNEEAIFRLAGTSVFSNILSFGRARFDRLAIGYHSPYNSDTPFHFNSGDTALQVNGTITIKELADANRTSPVPACINDFGVIELCNAIPVDGQCGKAQGGTYTNVPPQSDLCDKGTASAVTTNTSSYTWTCQGENGGSDAICTAKRTDQYFEMVCTEKGIWEKDDKKCSPQSYDPKKQYDVDNLICVDEQASEEMAGNDNDANCAEPKPVNGVCNNSVRNGCSAGTANDGAISDTSTYYQWRCDGQNGGSNSGTCQKAKPAVNGSCKLNHYECDVAGTSTNHTETQTQWTWICHGTNGGSNVNCSEAKPINGVCSPTHYGCDAGSSNNNVSDTSTQYLWHCDGINGGNNVYCSEDKVAGPPSCFIAGTKVTMADGSEKNIEEVKIGEFVLGNNGEISEVKGLHRPLLGEGRSTKLYSFNRGRYFVNSDHPFLTTEGWKAMDPIEAEKVHRMFNVTQLHVGDTLITKDGPVLLERIDAKEGNPSTQLYNLKLGGNHTYIADGYIVHNNK